MTRSSIMFALAVLLGGCATVESAVREDGMKVSYTGTADGAALLLRVTDPRVQDRADAAVAVADKAVDKGMSTVLSTDPAGKVRVSAGYVPAYGIGGLYGGGMTLDGTVPSTGVFVPGLGLVPTGSSITGRLPVLASQPAGAALDDLASQVRETSEGLDAVLRWVDSQSK